MDFASIDNLREQGFEGFLTVAELGERYRQIPDKMGIYLVVTPDGFAPHMSNAAKAAGFPVPARCVRGSGNIFASGKDILR